MTTSYVTYTYYTNTFLGNAIASASFARLALRASAAIDQMTHGRAALETLAATVDSIKMATCAVAEEIQTIEQTGSTGGIQSESIGSNSVTYSQGSTALLSNGEKMNKAASVYLGETGLLFAGFSSGEYGGEPDAD
jgi:hypothetical protein